jgi:LAO/AO transport system kinase
VVRPSNDALEAGIVAGDRSAIGRAITLIESTRESDERLAQELLTRLLPRTGHAIRVGVTGVPGAGKSTLLDALGMKLLGRGHKVAVLAVDPSSSTSGGSILGDKTRMSRLAREVRAFIRPSPSSGELGGVAPRTRDTMLVLEAAGFDVVLVETVGVGQSETAVHGMVDTFVWLTIPNAGDELQGIKRGVLELAELVVVNKADGDRATAAGTSSRARSTTCLARTETGKHRCCSRAPAKVGASTRSGTRCGGTARCSSRPETSRLAGASSGGGRCGATSSTGSSEPCARTRAFARFSTPSSARCSTTGSRPAVR